VIEKIYLVKNILKEIRIFSFFLFFIVKFQANFAKRNVCGSRMLGYFIEDNFLENSPCKLHTLS